MKLLSGLLLVMLAGFALMLSVCTAAKALPLHGLYRVHARDSDSPPCPLGLWVCFKSMELGGVDEGLCATEHIGNTDTDIADGNQVHFVFHCDFGVYGDSANVVPVDSPIVMSTEVSYALGYERVTLLPGWYPVNYSQYTYGETWIDAILTGPTANAKRTWGKIKSSYR